jgi:nucleotide-binding universal stress UspA family protein
VITAFPVVFGVDFAPIMRRAVPWVREFIMPGQPAVLAHALARPKLPAFLASGEPGPEVLAAGEQHARKRLCELRQWTGATDAEIVARPGRPDRVLGDVAAERRSPLLVIGAHGEPTRPWKRIGSTTERLLRAAESSLLVVRGPMIGPPRRIVAAVDDVGITRAVLEVAGTIADAFDADLSAVHVLSPAAYNHLISAEAAEAEGEAEAHRRVKADLSAESLRWLRALWEATDHHARLHADVLHGSPADEILRIARERSADLVVIGRYGIGRMIPAVLGSVVGSVVAGADCPVLVVAD